MYVIKNKEGLMMKIIEPSNEIVFSKDTTEESATKFDSESDAIIFMMGPCADACSIEEALFLYVDEI